MIASGVMTMKLHRGATMKTGAITHFTPRKDKLLIDEEGTTSLKDKTLPLTATEKISL